MARNIFVGWNLLSRLILCLLLALRNILVARSGPGPLAQSPGPAGPRYWRRVVVLVTRWRERRRRAPPAGVHAHPKHSARCPSPGLMIQAGPAGPPRGPLEHPSPGTGPPLSHVSSTCRARAALETRTLASATVAPEAPAHSDTHLIGPSAGPFPWFAIRGPAPAPISESIVCRMLPRDASCSVTVTVGPG